MGEENLIKICAQCSQEKLLTSQFYRTKNGKDGYMKHCKDCHKANLAASRDVSGSGGKSGNEKSKKKLSYKLRKQQDWLKNDGQQKLTMPLVKNNGRDSKPFFKHGVLNSRLACVLPVTQ